MSTLSFDWPLLRKPLLWIAVAWIGSMALLGVSVGTLFTPSASKWDRATAIGICDGLAILRLEDGEVRLRVNSVRTYRIEAANWQEICK